MPHPNSETLSARPADIPNEAMIPFLAAAFQRQPVLTTLGFTSLTLGMIEMLAMLELTIPNPPLVYLLAVVYCSYAGGTVAGILSVLLCVSYSAYFMFASGHIAHQPDRIHRLLVLAITTPMIAAMVGHQKARCDDALRRLRDNLILQNRRLPQRRDAQLQRQKERLDYLKQHDTVTGLPNRVQFVELATAALAEQSTCSILVIGLDRSRSANQVLAHAYQQTILRTAGERIQACLSTSNIVASLRGEEFVVLLNSVINENLVQSIAKNISTMLQEPYRIQSQDLYVDVHLGAAIYPIDADNVEQLIDRARLAMHHEQKMQSGSCQFYTRKMGEKAAFTVSLANDLRHAVERGELVLHYQPTVNARTGEWMGVEALVRWQHPVHGMISPLTFIPLAEESGLIVPIGEWVLRTACQQAVSWQAQCKQPLRMAVNLSARQFQRNDFLANLKNILAETGMPATSLKLEITESLLMDDPDAAATILSEIDKTGVQLAIDDFGTGYSSLSYLKRFPIHCLKIDRAFIQDLPDDRSDLAITRAIIALAQSLDMKVVAEGVETTAQQNMLMHEGCDEFQGYLFSRPIPAAELEANLPGNDMHAPLSTVRLMSPDR